MDVVPYERSERGRQSTSTKRKASKSGSRRSKRSNARRIQRTLPLAGMPDKKIVRMRYSDDVEINPTTAGFGTAHVLRLNSIHDPDYTGVGHQPMGHDEWSNFYQRYHVIGCRVQADFYASSNSSGTANTTVAVGFRSTTDVEQDGDVFFENGRCAWKRLATRDGSAATCSIVRNWSAKKWYGGQHKAMNDSHGAIFGTGPSDPCFAHLVVFPVAELSGNAQAVRCRFFIDYLVMLTEPKRLSLS